MKEYKINVDIYCSFKGPDKLGEKYRLYVDDDLITERTYIWKNAIGHSQPGQFLRENVWVNLSPGEHSIKLEPLNKSFEGFFLSTLSIDDVKLDNSEIKTIDFCTKVFTISE